MDSLNRKNFIITALLINFTICLTLCIGVFTDGESKETNNKIVTEKDSSEESGEGENVFNNNLSSEKVTKGEETTHKAAVILDNSESVSKTERDTEKIVESQVSQDTVPSTYINIDGITISNEEQTTSQQETVPVINGDTAVIIQSCNIRSSTDMSSSNRIGTAQVGSYYTIAKDKCTDNWIAIYLNDGTIGYISSSFCSYNS